MTTELTIEELEKELGSKERVLFYIAWLKNDMNATNAYQELHPTATRHSCRVGGSRMLANIDSRVIAEAFGLDHKLYFQQLKDGNLADKWNDFTGEREPDHKTRAIYHTKLGKLLGVETDQPNVQVNIANIIQKQKADYGI